MFDIYTFGNVCLSIIPLVIFCSILISALLGGLAGRSPSAMQIAIAISYILCIGVMVHEAAHRLFCAIFGVKVKETRYFRAEHKRTEESEYVNIGGYVELEEVNSTVAGIFLGLAPLIINGLCVALLYYYGPVLAETAYYPLCVYLGIALAMGARPSSEDLHLFLHAFKRAPGRGIFEIIILCCCGGLLIYLFSLRIDLWITGGVSIACLVILIMECRRKAGGSSYHRTTPRL